MEHADAELAAHLHAQGVRTALYGEWTWRMERGVGGEGGGREGRREPGTASEREWEREREREEKERERERGRERRGRVGERGKRKARARARARAHASDREGGH